MILLFEIYVAVICYAEIMLLDFSDGKGKLLEVYYYQEIMGPGIRVDQHILKAGLPRSMPNADQCRSMPIKIMALIRNVSQCRSLPINSELIGIGINARILIGIDPNADQFRIDRQ